jgi:hypothetical protein
MTVIATWRTGLALVLPTRLGPERLAAAFLTRQMIRAIAFAGVFAFLAVEATLQLADFASQLLVFGFQLGNPFHRVRMTRLPIARFLPQNQILPPHLCQFLAQRGNLLL